MHFYPPLLTKSTLSELSFLFTFPSKSQKYLFLGQKKRSAGHAEGMAMALGAHILQKGPWT